LKSKLTGGSYSLGNLTHRTGTLPLDSNPMARLRRVHQLGRELTGVQRGRRRRWRGAKGKPSLTARGGKDSGGTPPPLPGVRLLNGGRTRRRHPRPVARRRRWLLRTRMNGRKRRCLGACWEWGEFNCLIGGGFYRPGGRGRGRPVGGRRRGAWQRARAKPGTAALGACWRGLVAATGHCGSALARSRRSATCREQREKRGGLGAFFLFSSMSHSSGRGRGGWARPRRCPRAWLQG
jgi:hypothetical protein